MSCGCAVGRWILQRILSKQAQVIVYIFSSELWQKACKRLVQMRIKRNKQLIKYRIGVVRMCHGAMDFAMIFVKASAGNSIHIIKRALVKRVKKTRKTYKLKKNILKYRVGAVRICRRAMDFATDFVKASAGNSIHIFKRALAKGV